MAIDDVLYDQGGAVFNVKSTAYGAKGDTLYASGGAMTAASAVLTVTDPVFAAGDVGKKVGVPGAGMAGAVLGTTISAFTSATQVTLAAAAATSVTGARVVFGTDDTAEIQDALDAAAVAGGMVFIPAGTYLVTSDLTVSSGVTVAGVGHTSLLASTGAANNHFLRMFGATQVAIRDLGIDVNSTNDFRQGISIMDSGGVPSEDVYVERCHIFNSAGSPAGHTMMAVVAQNARRVWIRGNLIEGMQIKAAGGAGAEEVHVVGNTIRDPHEYGVSFVVTSSPAVLRDCTVSGNLITGIDNAGGIYLGNDSPNAEVDILCERISVCGNVMSGGLRTTAKWIALRLGTLTRDVEISGNLMRWTGEGTLPSGTSGILVSPRSNTEVAVENLVVSGNVVAGSDQPGIWVGVEPGTLNGLVVEGNTLSGTRGILLTGKVSNGRVTGNVVRGGVVRLEDCVTVDVTANTVDVEALNHDAGIEIESTTVSPVTSTVALNRVRAQGSGLATGIRETGTGAFATRYFANEIAGQTGAALALVTSTRPHFFDAFAGSLPVRLVAGEKTYDPPSLAAGATATTTVTANGARAGDTAAASLTTLAAAGWTVSAVVTANNTVTVSLTNGTGAVQDLASGTLRVLVWGY